MKAILINYCFTPEWAKEHDYLIYDRSDDGKNWLEGFDETRIIRTENVGNVDYDRLGYLVDNYDNLPEVFLWSKSNLFKYITPEEFEALDKNVYTPLLTQNHSTYSDTQGLVCFYKDGMYYERNNSWYLGSHYAKYESYNEFAREFALPTPLYIPFNPGGNFILTKEKVHKYAKDFYMHLREILPYAKLPGEAHFCERSYATIWS